jgi:hypothetical protein
MDVFSPLFHGNRESKLEKRKKIKREIEHERNDRGKVTYRYFYEFLKELENISQIHKMSKVK